MNKSTKLLFIAAGIAVILIIALAVIFRIIAGSYGLVKTQEHQKVTWSVPENGYDSSFMVNLPDVTTVDPVELEKLFFDNNRPHDISLVKDEKRDITDVGTTFDIDLETCVGCIVFSDKVKPFVRYQYFGLDKGQTAIILTADGAKLTASMQREGMEKQGRLLVYSVLPSSFKDLKVHLLAGAMKFVGEKITVSDSLSITAEALSFLFSAREILADDISFKLTAGEFKVKTESIPATKSIETETAMGNMELSFGSIPKTGLATVKLTTGTGSTKMSLSGVDTYALDGAAKMGTYQVTDWKGRNEYNGTVNINTGKKPLFTIRVRVGSCELVLSK